MKCDKFDWLDRYKGLDLLCPDTSDTKFREFELMGDHFSDKFNYIKVVFNSCAYKNPLNVTCADEKTVYDFFVKRKNKLQLFMKDTFIDAENHD